MEDTIIKSVGERLREQRKKLKVGQEEIARGMFSKNYISMFENGKRKINRRNAEYLTNRIKEIAKSKNIPCDIEAEYFLKSKRELAEEKCREKIEKLRNSHLMASERQREINTVIRIARQYSLVEELGEIHYIKGLEAYRGNRYRCAMTNIQESLNYFNRKRLLDKSVKSYELLGDVCFTREYYEEAIIYYNLGINMARTEGTGFDLSMHQKLSKSYSRFSLCKEKKDDKDCI